MGTHIPGKMVFILKQDLRSKADTITRLGLYDHRQFQEVSYSSLMPNCWQTTDLTQEVKGCWFNWALQFNLIWLTLHLTLDDLADLWTVRSLMCPQPLVYCYGLNTASYLISWVLEFMKGNGQINGLVQDCSTSSALAVEVLWPCTKPSKYTFMHSSKMRHIMNHTACLLPVNTLMFDQTGQHLLVIFFIAFAWMEIIIFWFNCHWSLFLRVGSTVNQHWFR